MSPSTDADVDARLTTPTTTNHDDARERATQECAHTASDELRWRGRLLKADAYSVAY